MSRLFDGYHYSEQPGEFTFVGAASCEKTEAAVDFYRQHVLPNGRLPKSALQIRPMSKFISHVWLVQHLVDEDAFKITVWGTGSALITGQELSGRILADKQPLSKWVALYRDMLAVPTLRILHNRMNESNQGHIQTEVVSMPIWTEGEKPSHILSVFDVLPDGGTPGPG